MSVTVLFAQDHSWHVRQGAKVMFTQFPAWIYMPCKNSIAEARKKWEADLPLQCAAAAEMSVYESELLTFETCLFGGVLETQDPSNAHTDVMITAFIYSFVSS